MSGDGFRFNPDPLITGNYGDDQYGPLDGADCSACGTWCPESDLCPDPAGDGHLCPDCHDDVQAELDDRADYAEYLRERKARERRETT